MTLDVSETLFSIGAAMNVCSYDAGLRASGRLRQQVRNEVAQAVERSPAARTARNELCRFYQDHRQAEPSLDLAQFVTLALNLGPPPNFDLLRREADLPPDAAYVTGVLPLL